MKTRYFKDSKSYFKFINKYKDKYKFYIKIYPKYVKVSYESIT